MKRGVRILIKACVSAWLCALVLVSALPFSGARAEATLSIELKGLSYAGAGIWRSVPLSGRFDVLTADGALLGEVTASPSEEELASGAAQSLSLPDDATDGLTLRPVDDAVADGFVCPAQTLSSLAAGDNRVTVYAYARQGLFRLQDSVAGAPAAGAEYVVVSSENETMLSVTTGADGAYLSDTTLPEGRYRLVQMCSAQGCLPQSEPVSFDIVPYFGRDEDVTLVTVISAPIPVENANASALRLAQAAFHRAGGQRTQTAELTIKGIVEGGNTVPLREMTLLITPSGLLTETGETLSQDSCVAVTGVRADFDAPELFIEVTGLDERGAEVTAPQLAASGESVALAGATSARVRYVTRDGDSAVLSEGFQAGELHATLGYDPSLLAQPQVGLTGALVDVQQRYVYLYKDTDGMSDCEGASDIPVQRATLPLASDRAALAFSATAQGDQIVLRDASAAAGELPGDTQLLVRVGNGARVDENELDEGLTLVRTEACDTVIFTLQRLTSIGVRLRVASGKATEIAVFARDPRALPRTRSNPDGLSVAAERHIADALWDAALNVADGLYAEAPCTLSGEASGNDAQMADRLLAQGVLFEDLDGNGTFGADDIAAANGVALLTTAAQRVLYGAVTDENGAFRVMALASENADTGALRAVIHEDGSPAVTQTEALALPAQELALACRRPSVVEGRALDENASPVPGVRVRLLRGESELAQTQTGADGAFRFDSLDAGAYRVEASVDEGQSLMPLAENGMEAVDRFTLRTDELALAYAETKTLALAVRRLCAATFNVADDAGAFAGVSLEMTDASGATQQRDTDGTGMARFPALEPGVYRLCVVLPEGMALCAFDDAAQSAAGRFEHELSLAAGDNRTVSLSLQRAGALAGRVDGLAQGQTVTAASMDAQRTAVADANGAYAFDALPAGDYTLYAPLMPGKALSEGSAWRVSQRGDMIWLTVSVAAGEHVTVADAAFADVTRISGVAYLDEDGDGTHANDEQLLTGVAVDLQREENGIWTDAGQQYTDGAGAFLFDRLLSGSYRVVARDAGSGYYVARVGAEMRPTDDGLGMMSGTLALRQGDSVPNACDVALRPAATIRAYAFVDSNGNGIRTENERAAGELLVQLVTTDGLTTAASATTDASGLATLTARPGRYSMRVTISDGYRFTEVADKIGATYSVVGGEAGGVAQSAPVELGQGQTLELGVGVAYAGSFSGRVWNDLNNNGQMEADEPSVAGVELTLVNKRTGESYALVSDDTGLYAFPHLRNGLYEFSAQLPQGMLFARYTKTGGSLRSIFTAAGTRASRDFGISDAENKGNLNIGVIGKGAIQGVAFLDLNYNGLLDEGEPGYANVTLEVLEVGTDESMGKVVTGEDGAFIIAGLRGDDYRLRAILPDHQARFTRALTGDSLLENHFVQREGRRENSVTLPTLMNGTTVETVVGVAVGATISGTVWVDADYSGTRGGSEKASGGVGVVLVDANGATVATATTNAKGAYKLSDIMPGSYTLRFARKNDYAFTRFRPQQADGNHVRTIENGWGVTELFTVEMGVDIAGMDAGMLPASTLAGVLFHDLNDNGLLDEGEPGMTSARVRLLSDDGDVDLYAAVDESGAYFFDGVMPGRYTLHYLLAQHSQMARVAAGGNTVAHDGSDTQTAPFSIEMGTANTAPLAGAVELGSLTGVAYRDHNGNGVRDEGEEALSGALISIAPDRAELEAQTATTGEDGAFALLALRPAAYTLSVELPEGLIISADLNALPMPNARAQTQDCPWSVLIAREALSLGAVQPATLVAEVWLDENRDGVRADNESRLPGLGYELYDEQKERVVQTVMSFEDGYAVFQNVRPGVYTIRFNIPEQAEPVGERDATFVRQGDRMLQSGVIVREGETLRDAHCGLSSRTSVGGTLRLYQNDQYAPVEGARVILRSVGDEAVPYATVTGEDGHYQFDGLWPGDYHLEIERPEDMIFVQPDDERFANAVSVITDGENGENTSDDFALRMAQHQLALDAICLRPARVGDLAWIDTNRNGLMDAGEPMANGVTVELLRGGSPVARTTTNAYGYYIFDSVYPGEYTLRATAYPELTITTPVPQLRMISSCLTSGDGDSATSDAFSVESGERAYDHDLGYILRDGQKLPMQIVTAPGKDWSVRYLLVEEQ